MQIKKDWIWIILAFIITSSIFFGYYLLSKATKLEIVYKNWDGPSYVLAAMSMYKPNIAYANNFIHSGDITPNWTWLPAHFPLYTLAIKVFSFMGYFQSMLFVSVIFTLFSYLALYELLNHLKVSKYPLLLTLPFIFISPRWFTVSHIGSSESMFVFFVIMFLLFFSKSNHKIAAIFIALAQATRPQGVFFGLGLAIVAFIELLKSKDIVKTFSTYWYYLSVPLTLLLVFTFFKIQTGDFFAFFSAISLTKNLQSLPFQTFTFPSPNVETFWQEVNAYDYVLFLGACLFMFKKNFWKYGILSLAYFFPLIFIHHGDISRYAIPLLPFAFIAYSEIIEKKEFTWATILMSPAVMMYAINFMDHNHGN